jgi:hypothetical protein
VSDDPNKLMLTIRYVAADDTFAVVDTAQGDLVVEEGFKRSIDAQRFALELYKALSFVRPTKPEDLEGSGGADGV